jgi:hypothetical protein
MEYEKMSHEKVVVESVAMEITRKYGIRKQ